jgi:hypothetical protein
MRTSKTDKAKERRLVLALIAKNDEVTIRDVSHTLDRHQLHYSRGHVQALLEVLKQEGLVEEVTKPKRGQERRFRRRTVSAIPAAIAVGTLTNGTTSSAAGFGEGPDSFSAQGPVEASPAAVLPAPLKPLSSSGLTTVTAPIPGVLGGNFTITAAEILMTDPPRLRLEVAGHTKAVTVALDLVRAKSFKSFQDEVLRRGFFCPTMGQGGNWTDLFTKILDTATKVDAPAAACEDSALDDSIMETLRTAEAAITAEEIKSANRVFVKDGRLYFHKSLLSFTGLKDHVLWDLLRALGAKYDDQTRVLGQKQSLWYLPESTVGRSTHASPLTSPSTPSTPSAQPQAPVETAAAPGGARGVGATAQNAAKETCSCGSSNGEVEWAEGIPLRAMPLEGQRTIQPQLEHLRQVQPRRLTVAVAADSSAAPLDAVVSAQASESLLRAESRLALRFGVSRSDAAELRIRRGG